MSEKFDLALLRAGVPRQPLDAHITAVRRLEVEARRAADRLVQLDAQVALLSAELENIANANIAKFNIGDGLSPDFEFRLWAQSRARHTLGLVVKVCGQPQAVTA